MPFSLRKVFLPAVIALLAFGSSAFAANRHILNGTWVLDPARSDFAGQPPIQSGTITIYDRQGNMSVSRNFTYERANEGADQTVEYSFATDGPESSTVHDGKTIKSKAKWVGDVLTVNTVENGGAPTMERFSLMPDNGLLLVVERPGLPPMKLLFHHQ